MRKIKIGKRILDVINEDEYLRRSNLNPEQKDAMTYDTAIEKDGYVYPCNKVYSENVPGVFDTGTVLTYSDPKDMGEEYKNSHIIDFENVESLQDSIKKQAELLQAERTILISPDNIFTPVVKEDDTPEMKLLKTAIGRKRIDLDNYKQRFGSDYNNDKRLFDQSSITFFKMKKLCEVMDMDMMLTLKDKPGAVNPIGEELTAQITVGGEA